MKVLITGFEPFGGETMNPAYEAVRLLAQQIDGADIVKLEIPVVFNEGASAVRQAIAAERPDIIICVGQAGGRAAITPEFVGINYADARIPDNAGQQPLSMRIKEDGGKRLFYRPAGEGHGARYAAGRAAGGRFVFGGHVCVQRRIVSAALLFAHGV